VIRRLEHLSSLDIEGTRPVIVVPIGSCEQHGPHLPLGTDTLIAEALAERLCGRLEGLLLGPSLAVTASGEHAGFDGTLSLGTDVTAQSLVELARSADWTGGIVAVNAHGGNGDALAITARAAIAEGRRWHAWSPAPVAGDDAHAGHTETSVMLALHPDLVMTGRAGAGDTRPLAAIAGALRRGGVRSVSASGVLGDPTDADAEAGQGILARWTEQLVESVATALAGWSAGRRP
jgi:mycofactocin system creatininase family protein